LKNTNLYLSHLYAYTFPGLPSTFKWARQSLDATAEEALMVSVP
jgi:hypothetical protein